MERALLRGQDQLLHVLAPPIRSLPAVAARDARVRPVLYAAGVVFWDRERLVIARRVAVAKTRSRHRQTAREIQWPRVNGKVKRTRKGSKEMGPDTQLPNILVYTTVLNTNGTQCTA